MDLNQSNTIILTPGRCSPQEIFNSSHIFLNNQGRLNSYKSNFPPPAVPHEGEHDDGNLKFNTLQPGSQCTNQKRQHEEPQIKSDQTQRKLHKQAPVDYKQLNNPFSDEKDNKAYQIHAEATYQATLGLDDPETLKEAETFKDWLQWEAAICAELVQLKQFRT